MFGKEPQITMGVGALLCVIGLLSRVLSDSTSITVLIPLFFGALLLLLGWLALAPQRTKTMMHIVAALALLGALGSLNVVPALIALATGGAEASPISIIARSSMLLLCGGLLGVCIASFVRARRVRANE
jgi:membrane-associated HD superfamily phosphohydrolase